MFTSRIWRTCTVCAQAWIVVCLSISSPASAVELHVVDTHDVPVGNAVVIVNDGQHSTGSPDANVTIEQHEQQFSPRVTVVHRNTTIHFPNRDRTQHHVYSFSKAKQFELELYGGDTAKAVTFDQDGIVVLGCNIHDWMLGYVYVTDAKTFGVTDENGLLVLPALSQETTSISVWHPGIHGDVPIEFKLQDIPSDADGKLQIAIALNSPDPLDFEPDPLQDLFRSKSP